MPITYNNRNEVLLNNNLDKSFQNLIRPLNMLHSAIFLNKYSIRDNFITSNCVFTMIVSFCVILAIITAHCYFTTINLIASIIHNVPVLYVYHSYDLIVYTIILLCNYIFNVYYSNNNVKLVLKLQEADKITNFSKNGSAFIKWNWLISLILVCYCVAYTIFYYCFGKVTFFFVVVYSISINLIYASRIMSLMTKNIYLWIKLLEFEFEKLKDDRSNGAENYRKLYKCYLDIFEAFNFFKKSFEFMVKIHIYCLPKNSLGLNVLFLLKLCLCAYQYAQNYIILKKHSKKCIFYASPNILVVSNIHSSTE